jgi:hypothetical protein
VAGAVVGRDADVCGAVEARDGDVAGAGALLFLVLPLDPHPAAPTPSTVTQAMAAIRCTTFLAVVTLTRFMMVLFLNLIL